MCLYPELAIHNLFREYENSPIFPTQWQNNREYDIHEQVIQTVHMFMSVSWQDVKTCIFNAIIQLLVVHIKK